MLYSENNGEFDFCNVTKSTRKHFLKSYVISRCRTVYLQALEITNFDLSHFHRYKNFSQFITVQNTARFFTESRIMKAYDDRVKRHIAGFKHTETYQQTLFL